MLSRPEWDRRPPDYYGIWAAVTSTGSHEPKTVKEALAGSDKAKWITVMEREMESLCTYDIGDLVELSRDREAVWSKWVYKLKKNTDGSIQWYKARLVAPGVTKKFKIDYDETFCSVVRFESVRTVIALAVQNSLKIASDGCCNCFPEWQIERRGVHETDRGF